MTKKKLTSQNVTRTIMRKDSPPARAFRRYLEVESERNLDALTRITLREMGHDRGPTGSLFTSIPADDYYHGRRVVEKVAAKLKRRTIQPGPAQEPGEARDPTAEPRG